MTSAIPADKMANYLLVIEWMVKQQQLLKQQQARIEKQQKELEALGKFTTLLRAEETEKPVVPPSQDLLKKPSAPSKGKKGKKGGPKDNHCGKTSSGIWRTRSHRTAIACSLSHLWSPGRAGDRCSQESSTNRRTARATSRNQRIPASSLPMPLIWLVWICSFAVGSQGRV